MEALLRFLFIVVIIYYAIKLFIRYALPWFLARFMKKQAEKFSGMNGFPNAENNQAKDGEVRMEDSNVKKKNKDDSGFGEYVDYEDVE